MKDIRLILATVEDASLIHKMKYDAFFPLYEKYQDHDTSPALEKIEQVIWQISHPNSEYYLIKQREEYVGAVSVAREIKIISDMVVEYNENINYISSLFILPQFQNKGIAQEALKQLFDMYSNIISWKLETVKQEEGNCHLYEKCGFVRKGEEHKINEKLSLIDYERRIK